ncbi:hypothetical protein [Tunicatimonas pelagia]|uniref:hypothetical protein n=1 Tax=Tunicatimonas pelagia TaxID=931531 RepID=UPI002665A3C8|nr:hypothetical protein [Tunicatimonas pelagia]WKN43028.1 hypothetical protein P0M28_28725 [Tunicatimonas pelagia]
MISLLFGNWRFLLDVLLVIALVVLLFIVNPFGIFGSGLQLGTTTNMVTEVQKIGQLVTAEYYGEVISSLDESRIVLIEENNTQQLANELYVEVKYALYDLYQYQQIPERERRENFLAENRRSDGLKRKALQNVRRSNIIEKLEFLNLTDSLARHALYSPVIEFLWRNKYLHSEKENWNPDARTEAEVLLNLYQELTTRRQSSEDEAFQDYLNDGFEFVASFRDFFFGEQKSALPRAERKKQLALVGRGWVKAGFNFDQLDENSFYLHEETGELHFFGLEPQILDADINPWFIPERGVPGFDIINYQGPVNFKDAQRVKEHCIQKLVFYAHQAQIIDQAQQQGAETLKSFFSLVTGQKIQRVHFHNDILTQTVKEIAQDEYINYYEGLLLDSILAQESRRVDSLTQAVTNRTSNEQLTTELDSIRRQSLRRLRKLRFEGTDQHFNYFSTLTYQIGLDSTVDQHERQLLKQVRWNMSHAQPSDQHQLVAYKDPRFWYEDSLKFMMEYNAALRHLATMNVQVVDTFLVNLPNNERAFTDWADSTKIILDYWSTDSTTTINYQDVLSRDTTFLSQLRYPFYYNPEAFRKYVSADTFITQANTPPSNLKSSFQVYDKKRQQLTSVALPPELFFDNQLLTQDAIQAGPSFTFILHSSFQSLKVTKSKEYYLSEAQAEELLIYFQLLQSYHQAEQSKGTIVRASEWVRKKLTYHTDSLTPLDQFRKFLSPAP